MLLEYLKLLYLHLDLHPGDRLFWFTTTGWMMWNLVVGALLTDTPIVLYDGNAGYPDLGVLWDLAAESGVTCFGTSAAFIAMCMKAGLEPARGAGPPRVRSVGSTGSPLAPEGFRWVYDQVGADTWLFSTSGGTDVATAFVGGVPTLPVYEGELQARSLGAAIEAWDEEGRPVIDQVGELVLTEPLPSMPVFFWGDEDGVALPRELLLGVPGRVAPRRLDRDHLARHRDHHRPLRLDHQPRRDPDRHQRDLPLGAFAAGGARCARPRPAAEGTSGVISLFVVLREGAELDGALRARIVRVLRDDCSPRHTPDEIYRVAEVPRTLSGKLLEVP